MVQLLLLKGTGIDPLDNQACTPLGLAVFNGHAATTLVLAAAGADVSLPYGPEKVPLPQVAASRGHDEVLRVLIALSFVECNELQPLGFRLNPSVS